MVMLSTVVVNWLKMKETIKRQPLVINLVQINKGSVEQKE